MKIKGVDKQTPPQGEQKSYPQSSPLAVGLAAQVVAGRIPLERAIQMLVEAKGIRRHG